MRMGQPTVRGVKPFSQIADVAQLTEVHLDGDEFTVQLQVLDARLPDELFQLGGQAVAEGLGVEIGKVNLCFFHRSISFSVN